ncbi:MAG: DUF4388 domain-containing protein [Chloroflexota bacterium]
MALKGNLRDFSTSQLFNLIHIARKTGTLSVENSEGPIEVAFRNGKLIAASTITKPAKLTTALLESGRISQRQTEAIERGAKEISDKELGLMLINAGVVSRSEIIQALRKHTLDIVLEMYTLPEGGFRFDSNRLPPGELITVAIDLDGVIIEGTRRLKEWKELSDELPNLDRSLKFAKRPNIDLERLRLTADEWRVISFINPKNSIRQIARATSLNDFDIRRIVYGMLQAGLIEYAAPVTARGQAVSRAVASSRSRARRAQKPEVKRSIVMKLIDRVRRI